MLNQGQAASIDNGVIHTHILTTKQFVADIHRFKIYAYSDVMNYMNAEAPLAETGTDSPEIAVRRPALVDLRWSTRASYQPLARKSDRSLKSLARARPCAIECKSVPMDIHLGENKRRI